MDALQDFHETLFNEISNNATAGGDFFLRKFTEWFCEYLDSAGEIALPEYAFYKDPQGRALNAYSIDDTENSDGSLNLFVSIYSGLNEVTNINKDEIESGFKHVEKFFTKSLEPDFFRTLEESSEGFQAAHFILAHKENISNVNLYLLTDKKLSTRLASIPSKQVGNVKINYHLWDLTKLYRLVSSETAPQDIVIDFKKEFPERISCLPANLDETDYKAYLAVVPGLILAKLYEQYGARLLERNVRSFLQARGKVNKGIRETILKKPEMFFAYNNGITATAETIEITDGKIDKLTNLQIVNGGQTTASLFSAYKKDKADISKVFVQMKLSVVSQELANEMVPLISKYANSQNKVNDADFFATHPFHKRMEDFSRRIYAPAVDGQFMQTKWFYERARGQYINGFAYGTLAQKRKFQTEYPKKQLFTKTDLAKFEGVWMQKPHIVSKGAQYIFLDYADMIDAKWQKDDTQFNEAYYRIAIAKAIAFKSAEKIVTDAPWYDGGYRANIVAYTLAYIAYKTGLLNKTVDFMKIWNKQAISNALSELIGNVAKEVHDALLNNDVISNVGQYAKKTVCWENIKKLDIDLPENFVKELVDESDVKEEVRAAKLTQKMDNQIASEIQVFNIGIDNWRRLQDFGQSKRMISPKELGILATLFKNGGYVSTAQSKVLLELLARLESEGFSLGNK